jgi:hypothetical protein
MESRHLQTIAHALVLVAIMLGLIAGALWLRLEPGAFQNEARAQSISSRTAAATDTGIPDAGKQRMMIVEQLQALNQRMADIDKNLRDGSYSIQIAESKGAAGSSRKAASKEPE